MNILSNLQEIASLIIRPSRYTYKQTDLGNKTFKIDQKTIWRQDFEIKNQRKLKIKGSIYTSKQLKEIDNILIYLHCNSGCRIQGLAYLKLAMQNDLAYCLFDFTGSGMSQGKHVSLGYYETTDLECVYEYLKGILSEKAKFIIWGRSMGAVTALNFLLKNKANIKMAVFDSPFRSLKQLFIQIGRQKTSFPDFILEMAYNYIKPIVLQKAGFDIEQVDLKLEHNTISTPGIFIASKQDLLVPFQQIDELFSLYKGEKQMLFIEEGHNEARNMKVIQDVFKGITKQLERDQLKAKVEKEIQDKKNYNSLLMGEKLEKKELSRKKLQLTIKSLSQRQLLATAIGKVLKGQVVKDEISKERRDQEFLRQRKDQGPLREIIKEQRRQLIIRKKPSKQQKPKQSTSLEKKLIQPAIKQCLTPVPTLQKKPISCLLPHKKSFKVLSIHQQEQNRFSFPQNSDPKKLLLNNKSESKLKVKRKPFQIKNFFGTREGSTDQINQKETEEQLIKGNNKENQLKGKKATMGFGQSFIDSDIVGTQRRTISTSANTIRYRDRPALQPQTNTIDLPLKQSLTIPMKQSSKAYSNHSTLTFQPTPKQSHPHQSTPTQSHNKPRHKQQPHSDIKTQMHKTKINFHKDFIKEKEFLKRCQSLQKVWKLSEKDSSSYKKKNAQDNRLNLDIQTEESIPTTQTYREIKCTQRVLEKILERQQKKLLILNIQGNTNHENNQKLTKRQPTKASKLQQKPQKPSQKDTQNCCPSTKQRKTMQHIANKKPPFVQLKGLKNYRNSLQCKYKTQMRK